MAERWRTDPMRILTPDGLEAVHVGSEPEASLVGSYWSAVNRLLHDGDPSRLAALEGETVAGRPLETDPFEVETAAWLGHVIFESIYDYTL